MRRESSATVLTVAQTAGALFLYNRDETFRLALHSVDSASAPQLQQAIGHAVLAIGAQASAMPEARTAERVCVSLAQKAAFAGMLESQNLYTVQIFTLLAFYMLGAGRRDVVFMYLGIAARAAVVIKLGATDTSTVYSLAPLAER